MLLQTQVNDPGRDILARYGAFSRYMGAPAPMQHLTPAEAQAAPAPGDTYVEQIYHIAQTLQTNYLVNLQLDLRFLTLRLSGALQQLARAQQHSARTLNRPAPAARPATPGPLPRPEPPRPDRALTVLYQARSAARAPLGQAIAEARVRAQALQAELSAARPVLSGVERPAHIPPAAPERTGHAGPAGTPAPDQPARPTPSHTPAPTLWRTATPAEAAAAARPHPAAPSAPAAKPTPATPVAAAPAAAVPAAVPTTAVPAAVALRPSPAPAPVPSVPPRPAAPQTPAVAVPPRRRAPLGHFVPENEAATPPPAYAPQPTRLDAAERVLPQAPAPAAASPAAPVPASRPQIPTTRPHSVPQAAPQFPAAPATPAAAVVPVATLHPATPSTAGPAASRALTDPGSTPVSPPAAMPRRRAPLGHFVPEAVTPPPAYTPQPTRLDAAERVLPRSPVSPAEAAPVPPAAATSPAAPQAASAPAAEQPPEAFARQLQTRHTPAARPRSLSPALRPIGSSAAAFAAGIAPAARTTRRAAITPTPGPGPVARPAVPPPEPDVIPAARRAAPATPAAAFDGPAPMEFRRSAAAPAAAPAEPADEATIPTVRRTVKQKTLPAESQVVINVPGSGSRYTPAGPATVPPAEVERIADKVYRQIEARLRSEKARRGM